jgi:uncharacterized protein (UPF0303 family)
MTDEQLLEELLQEENELQFESFSNETALHIGMDIIDRAKAEGKSITVDIHIGEQQVFHYACPGTSADNDAWTARKARIVNRFGRSSYYMEVELRAAGKTILDRYFLDPSRYAAFNGAFPIRVRGACVIGSVVVSGLPGDQDHKLVTAVLRQFIEESADRRHHV